MAVLKERVYRKNASGTYDTIHYETSADLVIMKSGDTVETAVDIHIGDRNNPHNVIASQITLTEGNNVQNVISDLLNRFNGTGETEYKWRKYQYEKYLAASTGGWKSYRYQYYASSYTFSKTTGLFTLTNPIRKEFSYDKYDRNAVGKYMIYGSKDVSSGIELCRVSDVKRSRTSLGYDGATGDKIWDEYCYITADEVYKRRIVNESQVYSTSPDTYPNGISGDWVYEYLGVNTANKIPVIEYGSYNGNGTYGSSGASSLSFGFYPVMAIIFGADVPFTSNYTSIQVLLRGDVPRGYGVDITFNDNSVTWYSSNAARQFNVSGAVYQYFAIGF